MLEQNPSRVTVIIDNNFAMISTLKTYLTPLVKEDNIVIMDPKVPNYNKVMSGCISQGKTVIYKLSYK